MSASGLYWGVGTMYCIKWSENHSKNKSHLILIRQRFIALSLGVLCSVFTTLISMACWSYHKNGLRINTGDLKLSSHLPASKQMCVFYPVVSPEQDTLSSHSNQWCGTCWDSSYRSYCFFLGGPSQGIGLWVRPNSKAGVFDVSLDQNEAANQWSLHFVVSKWYQTVCIRIGKHNLDAGDEWLCVSASVCVCACTRCLLDPDTSALQAMWRAKSLKWRSQQPSGQTWGS